MKQERFKPFTVILFIEKLNGEGEGRIQRWREADGRVEIFLTQ